MFNYRTIIVIAVVILLLLLIYREIKNRIHFDFPKEDYSGSLIRGNINWAKTLQNSNTKFPLTFFSSIQNKKFDTPGNILLVLCAKWLNQESSDVLQAKLTEPLNDAFPPFVT